MEFRSPRPLEALSCFTWHRRRWTRIHSTAQFYTF